jgi:type VI protein secretion system component Hcp
MAVDLFLKIDGIQGESTDASHADEINFVSYPGASRSRR